MAAIHGISAFYHDSAAALVVGGRIVAAAGQRNVSGTEKRLSCINVPEMGS